MYSNKAACLLSLNKYEECIETCNESLKIDEKFLKSMKRRAIALMNLGKFEDSIYQLR